MGGELDVQLSPSINIWMDFSSSKDCMNLYILDREGFASMQWLVGGTFLLTTRCYLCPGLLPRMKMSRHDLHTVVLWWNLTLFVTK